MKLRTPKKYFRNLHKNKSKAFSLVEILIVIAIIGVLAETIITTIGTSREKATFTKAKKDLQRDRKSVV